jgi:hypothetical protein
VRKLDGIGGGTSLGVLEAANGSGRREKLLSTIGLLRVVEVLLNESCPVCCFVDPYANEDRTVYCYFLYMPWTNYNHVKNNIRHEH